MNRARIGARVYLIMVSVVIGVSLLLGLIGVGRLLNVYNDTALSELLYLAPVVVILVQGCFEILRGMKLKPINNLTILWTMLFAALLLPLCILLNLLTQFLVPNAVAGLFSAIGRMPLLTNLIYCACLPALVEGISVPGRILSVFPPERTAEDGLGHGLSVWSWRDLNLNQFPLCIRDRHILCISEGRVGKPLCLHACPYSAERAERSGTAYRFPESSGECDQRDG